MYLYAFKDYAHSEIFQKKKTILMLHINRLLWWKIVRRKKIKREFIKSIYKCDNLCIYILCICAQGGEGWERRSTYIAELNSILSTASWKT